MGASRWTGIEEALPVTYTPAGNPQPSDQPWDGQAAQPPVPYQPPQQPQYSTGQFQPQPQYPPPPPQHQTSQFPPQYLPARFQQPQFPPYQQPQQPGGQDAKAGRWALLIGGAFVLLLVV